MVAINLYSLDDWSKATFSTWGSHLRAWAWLVGSQNYMCDLTLYPTRYMVYFACKWWQFKATANLWTNLTSFRSGVAEQTVYCPSTLDKIFIYRQMFSSWRMLVYNRKCQRIVVQAKFKSWNFPWFSPPPNLQLLSLLRGDQLNRSDFAGL